IEGDPFWEPARGLHFLFGVFLRDGGDWQYRPIWAHDWIAERRMFETFVDLVHDRLAADPGMHVYHYGTYENAAMKQLMAADATLALRDWLATNHSDGAAWAQAVADAASEDVGEGEREALRQKLIDGAEPGSPRWLAGELLQYHRREARPAWWWFFERRDQMTLEDLVDDAEAIGGITPIGDPVRDKQSFVQTFTFPAQEHKLGPGDQV